MEKSSTLQNLEKALAGESMAHIKYRYFAKIAREEGHEDIAKHFEWTADQEIHHAWGHLQLLVGKPSTRECLLKAIEGETYEFTTMYPTFQGQASEERYEFAVNEFKEQTEESKVHAHEFKRLLAKAETRFAALRNVEKHHSELYKNKLESL